MKKIISATLALLMTVSVFTACSKKEEDKNDKQSNTAVTKFEEAKLGDGIVATVNDMEISVEEFKFYLAQYCETLYSQNGMYEASKTEKEAFWANSGDKSMKESFYDSALTGYVGLASMVNLAMEKGLSVTDEEVTAELSAEGMSDAIEHYKTSYGITEDAIFEYMKKQMIYEKYAVEYIEKDERMEISDEDINKYFGENYIKAQHILKMTVNQETNEPLSEEEKNAVYKSAEEVLASVKKDGADFKAIMLEQSEDPGSQSQPDGYVFTEGEMVTEFYEGAKALKENEISDIIETSYGYHIIKRLPLDTDVDLANMKDQITSGLEQKAFQEILEEAKKQMTVKADYNQLYAIEGILY